MTEAPTSMNTARRRGLGLIAAALAVAGLAWGAWHWLHGRHVERTDNAYVAGHVVQITPQVSGTVIAIEADDTDSVRAGQTLVRLDPADARVALEQAEAQLAQTRREVRSLFANNSTLGAQIRLREADLARARADLVRAQDDVKRRSPLVASGAVGQEEFQHMTAQLAAARSAEAAAQSAAQAARDQLEASRTQTDGTSVDQHPNVLRAAARVREARLALQRVDLQAPLAGQVAKRSVQLGQRVQAGAPLMTLVALDQLWVDANFKESQLKALRIGQPAELVADVYGEQVVYHGRVTGPGCRHRLGLCAAAGAERHRQLDQDRAAGAGAHRAGPEGAGRAPAARGPVDGGQRRHRRLEGPGGGAGPGGTCPGGTGRTLSQAAA